MVDDENNDMTLDEYAESIGVDPATLETTYVFSDDGSFSLILAGIETKGVWSVDEDDVVSITMPTGCWRVSGLPYGWRTRICRAAGL